MSKKQKIIDKLTGVPRSACAAGLLSGAQRLQRPWKQTKAEQLASKAVWEYYLADLGNQDVIDEHTILGFLFLRAAILAGDLDPIPLSDRSD